MSSTSNVFRTDSSFTQQWIRGSSLETRNFSYFPASLHQRLKQSFITEFQCLTYSGRVLSKLWFFFLGGGKFNLEETEFFLEEIKSFTTLDCRGSSVILTMIFSVLFGEEEREFVRKFLGRNHQFYNARLPRVECQLLSRLLTPSRPTGITIARVSNVYKLYKSGITIARVYKSGSSVSLFVLHTWPDNLIKSQLQIW